MKKPQAEMSAEVGGGQFSTVSELIARTLNPLETSLHSYFSINSRFFDFKLHLQLIKAKWQTLRKLLLHLRREARRARILR